MFCRLKKILRNNLPERWYDALRKWKRGLERNLLMLHEYARKIHEENGIPYRKIVQDMRRCHCQFGASPYNYWLFNFHRRSDFDRDAFLTNERVNTLYDRLNRSECGNLVHDKNEFSKIFAKYMCRETLYAPDVSDDEVVEFIRSLRKVIVKPHDGQQGKGIHFLEFSGIEDPGEYARYAKEKKYFFEEVVRQHSALNKLNPDVLNTTRFMTVLDRNNVPHLIATIIRTATKKSVIDNMSQGGIAINVDLENGVLTNVAIDYKGNRHLFHPYTGICFLGFQMPFWQEAKSMVLEAATLLPQIRFMGWDVAFSENGPLLIEGNNGPCEAFAQMSSQVGIYHEIMKHY